VFGVHGKVEVTMCAGLSSDQRVQTSASADPDATAGAVEHIEHIEHRRQLRLRVIVGHMLMVPLSRWTMGSGLSLALRRGYR
jgi:hypothetical protein